jgi:hypothetical protein
VNIFKNTFFYLHAHTHLHITHTLGRYFYGNNTKSLKTDCICKYHGTDIIRINRWYACRSSLPQTFEYYALLDSRTVERFSTLGTNAITLTFSLMKLIFIFRFFKVMFSFYPCKVPTCSVIMIFTACSARVI